MGIDTAETPEVSTEEEAEIVESTEENAAEASEVSDGDEEQQEPAEIEVVRAGKDGSQPLSQQEVAPTGCHPGRVQSLNHV